MPSLLNSTDNTRTLLPGSFRYVRSDVPDRLTEEEIQWLLAHDLRTVVDLRTAEEAAVRPCPLETRPEFCYRRLPVSTGDIVPACPEDVPRSYLTMADDRLTEILSVIEGAASNVLYFCNAGKDRTGVVSAMLLRRMGASRQEIVDNYVISAENLRDMLRAFVAKRPELRLSVVTPRAWYMEAFLDGIDQREAAVHA